MCPFSIIQDNEVKEYTEAQSDEVIPHSPGFVTITVLSHPVFKLNVLW